MIIKGDPSLTKTRVSLKTWKGSDQGFLVECRAMEWEVSSTKGEEIEEVLTVEESVYVVLKKFEDVFNWPEQLPPWSIEHHVHLKQGTDLVNVRPYRYAFQQKAEVEKLADEMLASGVIRPSNNPYSSSVLLVRKEDGSWHFLCRLLGFE